MQSSRLILALALVLPAIPVLAADRPAPQPVIWKFDRLASVGGQKPTVLGAPRVVAADAGQAVAFNGTSDGLEIPANPIQGWGQFTEEVLFAPASDGNPEQRFFHIQQTTPVASRALLEIRLTPDNRWSLDAFLSSGKNRLALLDRTKLHPADHFTWVAMVYDGRRLASYVNGVKELEGDVTYAPMTSGLTTAGVRINRVFWFKGSIKEARFYPTALAPSALERIEVGTGVPARPGRLAGITERTDGRGRPSLP